MKERKMLKIEVVEDVEMNEDNGGWIVVKVNEDKVEEFVYFAFDFLSFGAFTFLG